MLLALLGGLVWHFLPMAMWQFVIEPQLRAAPEARRLRVELRNDLPPPPEGWTRHTVGNLQFSVPPGFDPPERCTATAMCRLSVGDRHVQIFPTDHLEAYADMVNLRAPDERDLSFRRSAIDNWATIRALRDRVTTSRSKLDSFRFESAGAIGVVAASQRDENTRWVVAAYSPDLGGSRGVGISGFEDADALALLGSLAVTAP